MAFNFSKLNKERLFDVDTSDFEYTNLEELFEENGDDKVYKVTGVYVGTKSQFDDETPLVAIEDRYVNLPQHQLSQVKDILADKTAIKAINDGKCGFVIESYYQKRFKKTCYVARWGSYDDLVAELAE